MAFDIEKMVYILDEPLADPASLNVLYISKVARDMGIKVLLSGTGGDDIFSGYRRHIAASYDKLWEWVPSAIVKILAKAVSKASSQGVKSFACVHDAFGVLACDSQLMNDCVRESFVEIFSKDNVLEDFCKEITPQIAKNKRHLIPELPKMRNLNISEVLTSDYFCS